MGEVSHLMAGLFIGIVIGFFIVSISIMTSGDIVINKEVLIRNNSAHYSTTNGSFILDVK